MWTIARHVHVWRSCRAGIIWIASWTLAGPHIPSQLFELSAHLCLRLSQIPSASGQDPAFEAHFVTAATRVMRHLVLLDIATYLHDQYVCSSVCNVASDTEG